MSISGTYTPLVYNGDNTTVDFPYDFLITEDADIVITETIIATGVETVKILTTDYTVTGEGTGSGTVTAVLAPASTVRWTVSRVIPRTQLVDLVENDALPAATLETAYDKLTMIVQEQDATFTRTLRQPTGDTDDIGLIPAKVDRASMFLAFDSDGDPVAASGTSADLTPVSTFINTLLDDATATIARATLGAAKSGVVTASDITMATAKLLGRTTASTGAIEEIVVGASLTLAAGSLSGTQATTSQAGVGEYATQAEADLGTPVRVLTTDLNKLSLHTQQATTSGTGFNFTGLPTGVRRVVIVLAGVSLSGTDNLLVQIGPSGGVETSTYVSTSSLFGSAPTISDASSTAAFIIVSANAAFVTSGVMTLTLLNSSTNQWAASFVGKHGTGTTVISGGDKSLAGALSQLTLKTTGVNTFDAGAVNVLYER